MSTYYVDSGSSGSQYYFNQNMSTNSHNYRSQASPVPCSTMFSKSEYSSYPTGHLTSPRSTYQTIRVEQDDPYRLPAQHQSVGGFNKNTTHQYYQTVSAPPPQVRARVRSAGHHDHSSSSNPSMQAEPQHLHIQYDHNQVGNPSATPVVYQTPGAAQFTHRNVDLWTESQNRGGDHYVQAQRVTVRSVSTGSPQQSQPHSPSRHQDSLQNYYSQLTPEQHQQLLQRQQQYQASQQASPSPVVRSTASAISGADRSSQGRTTRQDEQEQGQASHPVGIRSLMNKFAGPATSSSSQQRSRSTSSRNYSSLHSSLNRTQNKPATTMVFSKLPTMTYSALPKPHEPPVNSVEYYQMQLQQYGGQGLPNIQQAAAPAHIQHAGPALAGIRDRFGAGLLSDQMNENRRQVPPPTPTTPKGPASSLNSLRDQYLHQAEESKHERSLPTSLPHIPRTIVGEDLPQEQKAVSKIYPPAKTNSDEQTAETNA